MNPVSILTWDYIFVHSPVSPVPVSPAPVSPASVSPASVSPAPVSPAPVNPASVNPASVNPASVNPASVSPASVIKVEHLDHFFGEGELKKQVLFDINLDINTGEIIILTGPSGSGKTTLLSLMGGLRSPQSGSLQMLETELVGAAKAVAVEIRRSCGYIFQAHNLHTSLTAQENVMMGLEVHGAYSRAQRRDLAVQMLEVVGLGERTQYYAEALSGGQKQRVAIARALVSRPQIVLADEPTAALDKKSGRDVVELMQKLAKEQGCTILMVTHDNRILDVADRIIYMEDGRLSDRPEAKSD